MNSFICKNCKHTREISSIDMKKNGELFINCSKCRNKSKEWRQLNTERIKSYNQLYLNDNKDRLNELHKLYNQAHPEQLRDYNRKYANKPEVKERIRLYQAEYRKLHKLKEISTI